MHMAKPMHFRGPELVKLPCPRKELTQLTYPELATATAIDILQYSKMIHSLSPSTRKTFGTHRMGGKRDAWLLHSSNGGAGTTFLRWDRIGTTDKLFRVKVVIFVLFPIAPCYPYVGRVRLHQKLSANTQLVMGGKTKLIGAGRRRFKGTAHCFVEHFIKPAPLTFGSDF